jgi:Pyruvate/2-oxoacid:ferredoxin oxidoreductase gamma subunit
MRGGTENCSVTISRQSIDSPIIDKECNLLIVLNQPSIDRFLPELKQNGVLIYDSSTIILPECSADKIIYAVKASDIAKKIGHLRYANSVILGAVAVVMEDYFLSGNDRKDFDCAVEEAIMDCFADKQNVIQKNIEAFYAGKNAVEALRSNPKP